MKEYKKKKVDLHKIVVCKIRTDCVLRGFKPVYLYNEVKHEFETMSKIDGVWLLDTNWRISEMNEEDGDDEDVTSNITQRDICDVSYAKKYDFDQITISGITRPEDV